MNNILDTTRGIVKELKRVRWPKLKGKNGVIQNTIKVLIVTLVIALVMILGDLIMSSLLLNG